MECMEAIMTATSSDDEHAPVPRNNAAALENQQPIGSIPQCRQQATCHETHLSTSQVQDHQQQHAHSFEGLPSANVPRRHPSTPHFQQQQQHLTMPHYQQQQQLLVHQSTPHFQQHPPPLSSPQQQQPPPPLTAPIPHFQDVSMPNYTQLQHHQQRAQYQHFGFEEGWASQLQLLSSALSQVQHQLQSATLPLQPTAAGPFVGDVSAHGQHQYTASVPAQGQQWRAGTPPQGPTHSSSTSASLRTVDAALQDARPPQQTLLGRTLADALRDLEEERDALEVDGGLLFSLFDEAMQA
ncbi:hypothetical protein PR003_g8956 [Phytophthora rubi]|uniref:Uncharacterized protein n=1 Tax=Phytophthora rubi TaxID=129364 RepID=A0A6A4FPI0_9STRA|nr:hypothetical protein PR003_g8956 [Phytophthora rubi]